MITRSDILKHKGRIEVGRLAYLDGRDIWADPQLTIKNIVLWSGPDKKEKVGNAYHGQQVKVLDSVKHNKVIHFKVKTEKFFKKEGWVSELFISNKKHNPIGDLI